MEGEIAEKDDSGNFSLKSERGEVRINAGDILSISKLGKQSIRS
jgi:hypothetical protein